ncbi:MAG TPA: hypothetical protein VLE99_01760 [Candidatus Saccharimonadales bacterium]|nr:hypothetical protein [Candidatus Saccharimonadales bacterium]
MKTKLAGIATLLALAGIIVSVLFGHGTVAPRATVLTYIAAALFVVFQYVYLRSRLGWGSVKTVIAQVLSLVPQLFMLFILSFLWFVALPVIAMAILVMILGNRKL